MRALSPLAFFGTGQIPDGPSGSTFYLRRGYIWVGAIVGAFSVILGLVFSGHMLPEYTVLTIAVGALIIVEAPVLVWMRVYRNRQIILKEVEVTLTSEGIERRTDTTTWHVTRGMLERIYERNDLWIFVVNKLTLIAVSKQALV